jgi:hypothetical protein
MVELTALLILLAVIWFVAAAIQFVALGNWALGMFVVLGLKCLLTGEFAL